jgi:hypothetical protein
MDGPSNQARAHRAAPWALLLVVAAVFAPALAGDFVWDDRHLIEVNPLLDDLANLPRVVSGGFWSFGSAALDAGHVQRYYRPFISLTHLLVARATDRAPWAFHLLNLLAHLGCVGLALSWIRRRAEPAAWPWAVLAGTCAFALHPSRIESVAWISGSTDVWMTLWILVAHRASRAPGGRSLALACGAGAAAVLCKETAVVTPLLLASDAWLLASPEAPARPGLARAAWVALAVGAVVALHQWRVPFSADAVEGAGSAPARVLATLGCYVLRLVWPWPPSMLAGRLEPDAQGNVTFPLPWTLAGAAVALAAVGLAAAARRRPSLRPWLADALWLLVPLAPALNLVPLGLDALASDRFLYLPMLGAAALLTRALAAASPRAAAAVLAATAVVWSVTVTRGVESVLTEVDLWTHERSVRPASAFIAERLGIALLAEGREREALEVAHDAAHRAQRAAPAERNRLSLLAAQALVGGLPDVDQDTLGRVRDYYERVAATPPGQRFTVDTRYGALRYVGAPLDSRRVFSGLVLPRAQAQLRAQDFPAAEGTARSLLRQYPTSLPLWNVLLASLVAQGRADDALRAVRERDVALRASAESPLRAVLTAWATAPDDPVAGTTALLSVRAFQRARAVLATACAQRPDVAELRFQQVIVEALDRQWDEASARLDGVVRDLPAHAARAAQLRAELASLRARDRGLRPLRP